MYGSFLEKLFEPDMLLPAQFYGKKALSRQMEGEKRLMLAILTDAIECLDKYREAEASPGLELYTNTVDWIEAREMVWLYSFHNICELLGLDPDYLRKCVIAREQTLRSPRKSRLSSVPTNGKQALIRQS